MKDIFQLLSESERIKVLFCGAMNMDIQSQSRSMNHSHDSLPGSIFMNPGGVIRNIAENSSLLGIEASLLSVYANDDAGQFLINLCNQKGIDTTFCHQFEEGKTPVYSAFLDPEGEMLYAVNDMDLLENLTPRLIQEFNVHWNDYDALSLDTNLSRECLEYFVNEHSIQLIDPVSAVKIKKLDGLLKDVVCIKPNLIEAEAFTGLDLNNDSMRYKACEEFLNQGVSQVYLSAGVDGLYYMTQYESGHIPSFKADIASVTGAGDAASAALVLTSTLNMSAHDSALFASLVACFTLESTASIHKDLNIHKLNQFYKENNYEEYIP